MEKLISISVILLLLTACSSQSTKFKKAINVSLEHPNTVCELVPLHYDNGFLNFEKDQRYQLINRLSDLGYFRKKEGTRNALMGFSNNSKITEYQYEPTEKIKPYLDHSFFGDSLCFATGKVVKIVNYTEPANNLGVTTSQVKYTYTLNANAFAQDKAVAKLLGDKLKIIADSQKQPLEGTEWLMLTKNGWEKASFI